MAPLRFYPALSPSLHWQSTWLSGPSGWRRIMWWTPPVLRLATPPDPGSQVWEGRGPLSVNWWPGSPKVLYADAALQAAPTVSPASTTPPPGPSARRCVAPSRKRRLSSQESWESQCLFRNEVSLPGLFRALSLYVTNYCTTELFHFTFIWACYPPPDKETKLEIITRNNEAYKSLHSLERGEHF